MSLNLAEKLEQYMSQSKAVEKTMPRYWYNILFVASSACKKRDATFEVKDITRVCRYHHISKFYCARYRKTRKATSYRSARKLLLGKSGTIKMPNGFSGKKLAKKAQKQNCDNHHRILHIPNSLGIKFKHKLKILNFWT